MNVDIMRKWNVSKKHFIFGEEVKMLEENTYLVTPHLGVISFTELSWTFSDAFLDAWLNQTVNFVLRRVSKQSWRAVATGRNTEGMLVWSPAFSRCGTVCCCTQVVGRAKGFLRQHIEPN